VEIRQRVGGKAVPSGPLAALGTTRASKISWLHRIKILQVLHEKIRQPLLCSSWEGVLTLKLLLFDGSDARTEVFELLYLIVFVINHSLIYVQAEVSWLLPRV
jgi:hypothetical protein